MSDPKPGATCKFFIDMEKPECGKKAVATITTRITRSDQAKVDLCREHKRAYDTKMAAMRTAATQKRAVS
jgi:hypothetical protein